MSLKNTEDFCANSGEIDNIYCGGLSSSTTTNETALTGLRDCKVQLYKLNPQVVAVYFKIPIVKLEKLAIIKGDQNNNFRQKSTISNGRNMLSGKRILAEKSQQANTFKMESKYRRRSKTQKEEKPFQCFLCRINYSSRETLNEHNRTAHTKLKSYSCSMCSKKFVRHQELILHVRSHTGEKPFKCMVCDKQFASHSGLRCHSRTHTGEKPIKCKFCSETFRYSARRCDHVLRLHGKYKRYPCSFCEKNFVSNAELHAHILTHTGEKPYKCHICSKRFSSPGYLPHHLKNVHYQEKSYNCSMCTKIYSSSSNLNIHIRTHTGEKPYECALCFKLFISKSYLEEHKRNSHQSHFEHQCNFCELRFPAEKSLQRHMDKEHFVGENDFRCIFCETKFTTVAYLKDHIILSHRKEKTPYRCSLCEKSFGKDASRVSHTRNVHVNGKCYVCHICDHAFYLVNDLKDHITTHSAEKPYNCDICTKRFKSKFGHRLHMKFHT